MCSILIHGEDMHDIHHNYYFYNSEAVISEETGLGKL